MLKDVIILSGILFNVFCHVLYIPLQGLGKIKTYAWVLLNICLFIRFMQKLKYY